MTNPNNSHYNKKLQPFTKALRSDMTKAEACLWKYVLRARMMKGYPFRRQRPVLNYIADFMCKELNLIIEVDGITHTYEGIALNDKKRTSDLEKDGFTVLRYTDEEVLQQIDRVYNSIASWMEEHAKAPSPGPRQREKRGWKMMTRLFRF
ncbi:DUF559 domain-containing protein [Fulvivirga sp. M361]|uniref:endonuclease domain-containing protein n=1 Tax=Fulvivirga sp. M361 TaxID=2594266 RepID=UPI00117B5CE1|nr:DUF559 domain-containing protein [Fulvivirga sp. M361]TRX59994.1 DUF559 domain-containing protein [Fulvivirga sp. M361]